MSESIDAGQASDAYYDPYCEPCYDGKGTNIDVYGYCQECGQFLCHVCRTTHSKVKAFKGHIIKRGADMPQSMAAKPVRYKVCDTHTMSVKDQFCSDHKCLICSFCGSTDHKQCNVKGVIDVCKSIHESDLKSLLDAICEIHEMLKSVASLVDTNISTVKEKRKEMLLETESIYEKSMSRLKIMHESTKEEIQAKYKPQLKKFMEQQTIVKHFEVKIADCLNVAKRQMTTPIDAKVFLKLQELVNTMNQCSADIRSFNRKLSFVSFAFQPEETISYALNSQGSFGSIAINFGDSSPALAIPNVMFPVTSNKKSITSEPHKPKLENGFTDEELNELSIDEPLPNVDLLVDKRRVAKRKSKESSKVPATYKTPKPSNKFSKIQRVEAYRRSSHFIATEDDCSICNVSGLALTKDGRRLIADTENNKIKIFSPRFGTFLSMLPVDMKYLGSIILSEKPRDIAMISDGEAVVTTDNNTLYVLGITDRVICQQIFVKRKLKLTYSVRGVAKYKDKLIVTSPDEEVPCVKLIDRNGSVYWSLYCDQQGRRMFKEPWYVCSHTDKNASFVIVTDCVNGLIMLNGENGTFISGRRKKKGPTSITTDGRGNIYVSYSESNEITIFAGDMSEEKTLASESNGLHRKPQAILYDDKVDEIIVAYKGSEHVDFFKISSSYDGDYVKEKVDEGTKTELQSPGLAKKTLSTLQSEAGATFKWVYSMAFKIGTHDVKSKLIDYHVCNITGMAVTGDGRFIVVDNNNATIKMFSKKMRYLRSLKLQVNPRDIAVMNAREAAVTTNNNSIIILNISEKCLSHMCVKETINVPFSVWGVARYNKNKLVITCPDDRQPCLKLVDITGRVYWTLRGRRLFYKPWYVRGHNNDVMVTDWNGVVTKIDGQSGKIISRLQKKDKKLKGITVDSDGIIYVCCGESNEVSLLTEDFSQDRTILSANGRLRTDPQAIVYDDQAKQLILSYKDCNKVDVFKVDSLPKLILCMSLRVAKFLIFCIALILVILTGTAVLLDTGQNIAILFLFLYGIS